MNIPSKMSEDFFSIEGQDKAAFDGSIATLYRIDHYLKETENLRFEGDYLRWFRKILSLYAELVPLLKPNEIKEYQEKESHCTKFINVFATNPSGTNITQLGKSLWELEIWMRLALNNHNLLMRKRSDPSMALLNG